MPSLAASPSRALLSILAFDDPGTDFANRPAYAEQLLGPPAGPLAVISDCPGEEERLRSADVWGDAYAYRQCDDSGGHVEIRDESAAPLSPARSVGSGGFGVRIAGRYVAWLEGVYSTRTLENTVDVVVYDRTLGTEAYRIPRSAIPGTIHGLDVQDDGKVAIAYNANDRTNDVVLGWASPQEPRLHQLPLPRRGEYGVRMANNRIAFQAGRAHDFTIQHADIGISDLAGHVRRVARNTDAFVFSESFDYDGEHLLWRELGCEQWRLVVRAASAARTAAGGPTHCHLRLLRRPVVHNGVATLRVGCGAFSTPCLFHATLKTRSGAAAGRSDGFAKDPIRVPLSRTARRTLRRHGALSVRATVRLFDAAERQQTRHATVRLRSR